MLQPNSPSAELQKKCEHRGGRAVDWPSAGFKNNGWLSSGTKTQWVTLIRHLNNVDAWISSVTPNSSRDALPVSATLKTRIICITIRIVMVLELELLSSRLKLVGN